MLNSTCMVTSSSWKKLSGRESGNIASRLKIEKLHYSTLEATVQRHAIQLAAAAAAAPHIHTEEKRERTKSRCRRRLRPSLSARTLRTERWCGQLWNRKNNQQQHQQQPRAASAWVLGRQWTKCKTSSKATAPQRLMQTTIAECPGSPPVRWVRILLPIPAPALIVVAPPQSLAHKSFRAEP